VGSFRLRLEVQPTVLELNRKYDGEDWDRRLSATNSWSFGYMPSSRFGFWCDRRFTGEVEEGHCHNAQGEVFLAMALRVGASRLFRHKPSAPSIPPRRCRGQSLT
jgi:hypothetical protein